MAGSLIPKGPSAQSASGVPQDVRRILVALQNFMNLREGDLGDGGEAFVTVNALKAIGVQTGQGAPVLNTAQIALGDRNAPKPPTNLVATNKVFANELTWKNPVDDDLSHIEVWAAAGTQSRDAASRVAIVTKPNDTFLHGSITVDLPYTYWVRAVDYSGNHSPWCPPDSQGGYVVPEALDKTITDVLAVLQGQLTESELYSDLRKRINYIDHTDLVHEDDVLEPGVLSSLKDFYVEGATMVTAAVEEIDAVKGQWTVKIDTNGRVAGVGLINPASGSGSEFIILADKFRVVLPNGDGPALQPFTVGLVEGQPAVGIDGNLVVDESILARHIDAGAITADKFSADMALVNTIRSGNYSPAASGWKLDGSSFEFNTGGSIGGALIKDGTVVTDKIASSAITGAKIAANTITGGHIATNTLHADTVLVDGSLGASKIAAGAITADRIQAGSISATQIAVNGVDISRIASGVVTSVLHDMVNVNNTLVHINAAAGGSTQVCQWFVLVDFHGGMTVTFYFNGLSTGVSLHYEGPRDGDNVRLRTQVAVPYAQVLSGVSTIGAICVPDMGGVVYSANFRGVVFGVK